MVELDSSSVVTGGAKVPVVQSKQKKLELMNDSRMNLSLIIA